MTRDKFAAMASRAKIENANSVETGAGDNIAEGGRQQQQNHQQQTEAPETAPGPKHDQMAALTARSNSAQQQQQQPPQFDGSSVEATGVTPTTGVAPPPKRDKMAALAARSQIPPPETGNGEVVAVVPQKNRDQQELTGPTSVASIAPPPKRDKMAALAARSQIPPPETSDSGPTSVTLSVPPPKRDKMAALAARSQIPPPETSNSDIVIPQTNHDQQQPQQLSGPASVTSIATPPKRDKMAALAARLMVPPPETNNSDTVIPKTNHDQQQPQKVAGPASVTSSAPPPKRDKMAALAARSQMLPPETRDSDIAIPQTNHDQQQLQKPEGLASVKSSAPPPKRDKMAALAARSNNIEEQQTDVTPVMNQPPSRRDKLAALASRSNNNDNTPDIAAAPSRNNKFARLATATAGGQQPATDDAGASIVKTKSKEEIATEVAIAREKHLAKLKERLSKRKGILNSLDRAEMLTCKLLKIAAQTTDALQDLNFSSNLSQLSIAYRSTLQELHPLLTVGTEELIKPYQNHTEETKQSMYAARVEMRLAKERLEVLKTFTELEREERKEITVTATASDHNKDSLMHGDESDRKRKR